MAELQRKLATGGGGAEVEELNGVKLAARNLGEVPARDLKGLADAIGKQLGSGVVALVSTAEGKASIVVGVSQDLTGRFNAVALVRAASAAVGGKGGGGRADMAQAGGPDGAQADAALAAVREALAASELQAVGQPANTMTQATARRTHDTRSLTTSVVSGSDDQPGESGGCRLFWRRFDIGIRFGIPLISLTCEFVGYATASKLKRMSRIVSADDCGTSKSSSLETCQRLLRRSVRWADHICGHVSVGAGRVLKPSARGEDVVLVEQRHDRLVGHGDLGNLPQQCLTPAVIDRCHRPTQHLVHQRVRLACAVRSAHALLRIHGGELHAQAERGLAGGR